jgi:hypothetical protein
VLVTSRAFAEYEAFFALSSADLSGRVLDCAAGASGLAAGLRARGGRATALDPAYARGTDALLADAHASVTQGAALVAAHADRFVWDWYGTPGRKEAMRRDALAAFTADLRVHPDTYVAGALPDLPFRDDAFGLALCSHLLFTWSDTFGEEWHRRALRGLLRVAREVRVFPLVVQSTGEEVPFLPRLLDGLRTDGYGVEVRRVPYEFQRGADRLLALTP